MLLKADTMLEAIQPMIIVLLFNGIPFIVIQNKESQEYKVKTKKIFVICSILGYSIYLWIMCSILTTDETAIGLINGSSLFKFGDRFKIYSDFFILLVVIIDSMWKRDFLSSIMSKLLDIDNMWKALGVNKNYTRIKRKLFFALIFQGVLHVGQAITICVLMYYWMNRNAFTIIYAMTAPGYAYTSLLSMYQTSLGYARLNLAIINSELELICKHSLLTKTGAKKYCLNVEETCIRQNKLLEELQSTSRDAIVIQRLTLHWKIYDRLCDYYDCLNSAYFIKLLLIIGVSFTSMVINLFIGLNAVGWIANERGDENAIFFMLYAFFQGMVNIVNIFLTIFICQLSQNTVSLKIITIRGTLYDNKKKKLLPIHSSDFWLITASLQKVLNDFLPYFLSYFLP